jgi:DNA invertase Pin-like site-specific DNA recombinase
MEPKTYGYARVSTLEQNLEMQTRALEARGCTEIVVESISGAETTKPQLEKLLLKLAPGDTLVVWKLDRLGRNLIALHGIVSSLGDRNINFVSLTETIDTTTIQGKLFFNFMASIAEFERELIRQRVVAGVQNAMINGTSTGIPFGRPRIPEEKFIEAQRLVVEQRQSIVVAAKNSGLSPASFVNWRKKNGFSNPKTQKKP